MLSSGNNSNSIPFTATHKAMLQIRIPTLAAYVSRFGRAIPLSRQFRGGFSRGEIQRLERLHVKALLNVHSFTSCILSSACLS